MKKHNTMNRRNIMNRHSTIMRKHIPFAGLTSNPTDHESADGQSAALINLIAEDDALRPLALHETPLGSLPAGARLAGIHTTDTYRHLLIEVSEGGRWAYYWTAVPTPPATDASELRLLHEGEERVNAFAAVGDTLCLTTDSTTAYALWDDDDEAYCVVTHDDLLYDLTLTQDNQLRRELTVPITTSLAAYLDAPTTATSRQAAVAQMFPELHDSTDAYTTGATMVAAAMEAAADHEVTLLGQGTHKHLRFGIAALRMADGSHLLCSNLFALLPADLPTRITADREAATLHATIYLHRHTLTVDLHQPLKAARLITGVDIFLTRELTMLDLRQAATIVSDMEGHTTALTFAHLDRQATLALIDRLPFYKVLTVGPDQWGQPVMVPQTHGEGEGADLSDLRRWQAGARVAASHNGRLSLGAVVRTLCSPFEIGLTYRYLTLDAAARQALAPEERETALATELVAGSRADIADEPLAQTCDLVVHAQLSDPSVHEAWWSGRVQYPIPGMMMAPHDEVTLLTYHIRLSTPEGTRYYTTTQRTDALRQKGLRLSVHTATGQAHRVERAALHSLLLQQARVLHLDGDTGEYASTYLLWQPSTAGEWEAQAAQARRSWTMTRDRSLLRTSLQGNPLIFPQASAVHVGDGEVTRLVSNTRRTADGLFGDGQYYAFTTKGLWVLRLSGDRWKAQQTVTRSAMTAEASVVATDDAVAYTSPRGLMMVRGSVSTCLSDALRGLPFATSSLPHFADIVHTEAALEGGVSDLPALVTSFIHGARLLFDHANQRLWLHHPSHPHLALVYSLRSNQWGTAIVNIDSSVSDGDTTWAVTTREGVPQLVSVTFEADVHERQAVLLCTRPLSLGLRHVPKTALRVMVRGLFCHQGALGSHLGIALYGSDDLCRWQLIGSSANQYMRFRGGTPYKWFRLVAIGQLLPGESLEGASIELVKRWDNKIR